MAKFDFGFKGFRSRPGRNKFRSGLGGRRTGFGGTRGPRPRPGFVGAGGPSFFGGGFGVNFTLNNAKSYFFDAKDWSEILEPAELKALHMAGAIIRRTARGMIRRRKRASKPGQAPTRWVSRSDFASLTNILYAIDPSSLSVIIGPIFISSTHKNVYTFPQPSIPATLEFGGSERVGYATVTRQGEYLPKNRVIHIKARPYMKRALDSKIDRINNIFLDLIGRTPECIRVASRLRPGAA